MKVTVEGVITSIEEKTKDEKEMTEFLLAQQGEKMQVSVRLPGKHADMYTPFEVTSFTGRLMQWKTRDGIGSMVLCE